MRESPSRSSLTSIPVLKKCWPRAKRCSRGFLMPISNIPASTRAPGREDVGAAGHAGEHDPLFFAGGGRYRVRCHQRRNRHKQRRRDQTDRSEKQQVSKFHNSSRTSHLYRRSSAFRGSSAVSHKSQRQSTTTAATIMTALVTKGTLAIR